MVNFVTLEVVKRRLHIDYDDDDATLNELIEEASGAVVGYLKKAADPYLQGGDVEIPIVIRTATILMVGYLFRNPDQDPDHDFEPGYLPRPVISLLYPLRDPAAA